MIRIALIVCTLLWACNSSTQQVAQEDNPPRESTQKAMQIIDEVVAAHGGMEKYEDLAIAFEFRDRTYKAFRNNGLFQYERIFEDSLGTVRDILRNDGFVREIEGQKAMLHDTMKVKYTGSVSSVIYFAMLPFPLKDPAVIPTYLGEVELDGRKQHKIEVRFQQEGGGPEFEDVFMYWIDTETYHMNFLGYLYHSDGGGIRFRKGYNVREVGGIRFADYINYKADYNTDKLAELDQMFDAGNLEELSRIESEDVRWLEMPEALDGV